MTPEQEALLLALARAFRTHMIEQALKDGRDPKDDVNLSVLHMALQTFDYEYDLKGPIDLNIQQHMLGDPQYRFKLVGDDDPTEPFINPDDTEETP